MPGASGAVSPMNVQLYLAPLLGANLPALALTTATDHSLVYRRFHPLLALQLPNRSTHTLKSIRPWNGGGGVGPITSRRFIIKC